MAIARSTLDIPNKPAERRAWILYRLRCEGLNFRRLGAELGVSHQAVSDAARGKPSRHIEAAIAAKIGVKPEALFPEHYDRSGRRIPVERATERKGKGNPPAPQRNVENEEAA